MSHARIYISTGEPSGDLHGAGLASALRRRLPDSWIEATGGPHLGDSGAVIRHSIEDCGASGVFEAIDSIPRHLRILGDLRRRFRAGSYDLVVLVDYPGFHLRVARAAAEAGIPVLYYIAPQLWAWGAGRAPALRRTAREVAVVLPFEQLFFQRLGIPTTFVGHPLLDQPPLPSGRAVRERLGLGTSVPVLGLFPGSRSQEITRLWPVFREAARLARRAKPDLMVVAAGFSRFDYPDAGDILIHRDAPGDVLAASEAVICKSGTVTLQAALAAVPMVIAYRVHPLTYLIARRALKVRHIGLVNLVADQDVAPELLQDSAHPAALAEAVLPLLDPDSGPARNQRIKFHDVRRALGSSGAADRVAEIAVRLVA